jgi:hemerythrin
MALIEWDNSYNTEIDNIDMHHKHLVLLLNKSYDAMQINNKYEIGKILNELTEYTMYHFNAEHNLMIEYNYDSIHDHLKAHSYFINKVDELKLQITTNNSLCNLELVVFLKDWLIDHILVTDRELFEFICTWNGDQTNL